MSSENRRPIAARNTRWANIITQWLIQTKQTPNSISVWSIVFAVWGSACILLSPGSAWSWLVFALCMQLRLLCNLFDGMVAVAANQSSAVGALYNEVPDRISDSLFFLAAAYSIDIPELGWAAALFAALTAYIRVLGGSLGLTQVFAGPLAKQQRMAVLTVAAVVTAIEVWWLHSFYAMSLSLLIIAIGSVITCYKRLQAISAQLRQN